MAEDKKPDKKPEKKFDKKPDASAGPGFDMVESLILLLLLFAVVSTVLPAIFSYFSSGEVTFYGIKIGKIFSFFKNNVWLFKTIGFGIAGFGAMGTFAFNKMSDSVWSKTRKTLYPDGISIYAQKIVENKNPMAEKWKMIKDHSESKEESNWRIAIIEADILLEELLDRLRLPGDTVGDKLKAVEPSDFTTINSAWEAHKVRNMIAHEGKGFLLSQREVRRVIAHYEAVFREFELI